MDIFLNDRVDDYGNTLINRNCWLGNIEKVRTLLAAGADTKIPDFHGSYPLHNVVSSQLTREEKIELINELLNRDADIDATNNNGETALHLASMYGNKKVVEELLSRGANINLVNIDNASPLHFAVCFGNAEIAKILKGKGADDTITNREGLTPLGMARRSGNNTLIEALCDGGMSFNQTLIDNIAGAGDVILPGTTSSSGVRFSDFFKPWSMPRGRDR